jgi:hypothetical protein
MGRRFLDAAGNPLSNGFIILKAAKDVFCVWLDRRGNVTDSPLVPTGKSEATAHSSDGTPVWDPHDVPVLDTPSPFNIGTWVPGLRS